MVGDEWTVECPNLEKTPFPVGTVLRVIEDNGAHTAVKGWPYRSFEVEVVSVPAAVEPIVIRVPKGTTYRIEEV